MIPFFVDFIFFLHFVLIFKNNQKLFHTWSFNIHQSHVKRVYSALTFIILSSSCLHGHLAALLQRRFFFFVLDLSTTSDKTFFLSDPVWEFIGSGKPYVRTQFSRLTLSHQRNIVASHILMIIPEQNHLSLLKFVGHSMCWFLPCHLKPVICLFLGAISAISSHFRKKERNCAVIFHFVITDNRWQKSCGLIIYKKNSFSGCSFKNNIRSSHCGLAVTNLPRIHEDAGSIPWPCSAG